MRVFARLLPLAALAFLLASTIVLAPLASAARPPGPPGRHRGPSPERVIEKYADRLGIDPTTVEAIHELAAASRQRGRAIDERLHAAHEEMRGLLGGAAPDRDRVLAQAEVINAIELEAQRNRLSAMLEIRALLTPEQREELVRIRDEERGLRGRHRDGPSPLHACREDAGQLCPEARGQELVRCLAARWDELSEPCRFGFENPPPPHRGPGPGRERLGGGPPRRSDRF